MKALIEAVKQLKKERPIAHRILLAIFLLPLALLLVVISFIQCLMTKGLAELPRMLKSTYGDVAAVVIYIFTGKQLVRFRGEWMETEEARQRVREMRRPLSAR